MPEFKVKHFKKECICCGACAAICPDFWEMDEEGFAQMKGGSPVNDHWEMIIDSLADKTSNQEAADACPVQIIKIEEIEED